jgi:hypothetical protein
VEPLAVPHPEFNRVARQLDERSPETLGFETRTERVLMLALHPPIEPTIISGHSRRFARCPQTLATSSQTCSIRSSRRRGCVQMFGCRLKFRS